MTEKLKLKLLTQFSIALAIVPALAGAPSARAASRQPYAWKEVQIYGGGFVTGIVFHPNVQNIAYCRTDVGGAYRWNAATNAWEPLLDFYKGGLGVESIALDPTNSNQVYIAGGNWDKPTIFSSTNRGTTFTQYPFPVEMGPNNDGRSNGERMVVDPNSPNILYYASRSGLYKSVNYAQTWSLVSSFPVTTTTNTVGPNFVQFIKSSGSSGSATPVIYVGVSRTGSNLYRSTNGGNTWSVVNTSAAGSNMMPHRAAVDDRGSGTGSMYVTFSDFAGPNGVSAGAVLKLNLATQASTVVTPPTGQGGFGGVSVSKTNPNEVAISTLNRWWPHEVIYLSTNGGSSWIDTTATATIDNSSSPWMNWHGPGGVGTWTGDCEIDPFNSNRLLYITGGGVMGTNNLTASSPTYMAMSKGIEEMGGSINLAAPPSGPILYAAFYDIGGFADYNLDVSPPAGNFDPAGSSNTSIDFAESNPAHVVRLTWGLSNYGAYSTDYGATWTQFATKPTSTYQDIGKVALSPTGANLVWSMYPGTQFYSTNHGSSWTQSTGGVTNDGFAIADRADDNAFYVYARSTGQFYASSNGGKNFSVVSSGILPQWGSTPPVTVFGRAGDMWLATWNGLYHSTNRGTSWTRVTTGDAAYVAVGRAAPGAPYPAVYFYGQDVSGGTYGVYRSTDGGATWLMLNGPDFQLGNVQSICGDERTFGRVYVEAEGYGIRYGDDAGSSMPADGTYTIVNRNSGMAMDDPGSSMADGIQLVQWTSGSATNQKWIVKNLGSNKIRITSAASGYVAAVLASSTSDGAAVVQTNWTGIASQIWTLTSLGSGYYTITNSNSGKALEVPGWSTTTGTKLDQWAASGNANQQWSFK